MHGLFRLLSLYHPQCKQAAYTQDSADQCAMWLSEYVDLSTATGGLQGKQCTGGCPEYCPGSIRFSVHLQSQAQPYMTTMEAQNQIRVIHFTNFVEQLLGTRSIQKLLMNEQVQVSASWMSLSNKKRERKKPQSKPLGKSRDGYPKTEDPQDVSEVRQLHHQLLLQSARPRGLVSVQNNLLSKPGLQDIAQCLGNKAAPCTAWNQPDSAVKSTILLSSQQLPYSFTYSLQTLHKFYFKLHK